MSNTNTATDCPICLCPITSEPWGVVAPCGHPYHRECWDQVKANHIASGGGGGRNNSNRNRRGDNNNPSCSLCNGATRGFVPVFLDVGGDNDNGGGGGIVVGTTTGSKGGNGNDAIDGDDNDGTINDLEKLYEKWDQLWAELEKLCGCNNNDEDEQGNDGNNEGSGDNNGGIIDMTTDNRSDRYVADICATIDLTQHSPPLQRTPPASAAQMKQSNQETPIYLGLPSIKEVDAAVAAIAATTEEDQSLEMEMKDVQEKEKQGRIQEILQQLKCLQKKIVSITNAQQFNQHSSSSTTSTSLSSINIKLQHLTSKVQQLKSTNAILTTQNQSLSSTNESLSTQITQVQQTALDRTIEAERTSRKYETLQSQFSSMEESYKKYTNKSHLEQQSLQRNISKLQLEYTKLSNQVGLEDVQEMQEIRRKYSKMSNDLHESKMKNAKLNQDKREYEKKERDWVLKLGREKEKYNLFSSQVRKEMGNAALVKVFHDMTSSTPLSKMMNGEQRNSSKAVGGGASFASSGERVNNGYVNHQGTAAVPQRHLTTASSTSRTNNGHVVQHQQKRSSKVAMSALDKASSRKFPQQLKKPSHLKHHQQRHSSQTHASNSRGTTTASGEETRARATSDNAASSLDGVQLMMRRSSKKRRHGSSSFGTSGGSSSIQHGDETSVAINGKKNNTREHAPDNRNRSLSAAAATSGSSSSSSRKLNGVSASWKKGNGISSFFKPVANEEC